MTLNRYCLAALVTLAPWAAPAACAQPPDRPVAVIEPLNRDFGTVLKGQPVRADFLVRNVGGQPLEVSRVEFSHAGMNIRIARTVAPGEAAQAVIEWDTERFSGDAVAAARLHLNDPVQPQVVLGMSGHIVPPIEVRPRPALYLSQFVGETTTRSLEVLNHQQHAVSITGIERLGDHFTARIEDLEPGKTWRLEVTVPAATAPGRYREALRLNTDDPGRPQLHVEVNVLVKPPLYANPEVVDFGQISRRLIGEREDLRAALTQVVAIERQEGTMSITAVESDLPAVVTRLEPESGSARTFRLDVSLAPGHLVTGPLEGVIRVGTDDPASPLLEIPVRGVVED